MKPQNLTLHRTLIRIINSFKLHYISNCQLTISMIEEFIVNKLVRTNHILSNIERLLPE